MYKIEKNVPITGPVTANGRPPIYPLRKMDVGDSFLAKGKRVDDVRRSIDYVQRTTEMRFTARQIGPDARVWRTG